jgi:hypothetical protein
MLVKPLTDERSPHQQVGEPTQLGQGRGGFVVSDCFLLGKLGLGIADLALLLDRGGYPLGFGPGTQVLSDNSAA